MICVRVQLNTYRVCLQLPTHCSAKKKLSSVLADRTFMCLKYHRRILRAFHYIMYTCDLVIRVLQIFCYSCIESGCKVNATEVKLQRKSGRSRILILGLPFYTGAGTESCYMNISFLQKTSKAGQKTWSLWHCDCRLKINYFQN